MKSIFLALVLAMALASYNAPGGAKDSGMKIRLKVGDKVLFGKYAGQTVKVDGKELLVMREDDIMAIIE